MPTRKTNLSYRRMYIETDFQVSCINKGDNVSASRISYCYSCQFFFGNHIIKPAGCHFVKNPAQKAATGFRK